MKRLITLFILVLSIYKISSSQIYSKGQYDDKFKYIAVKDQETDLWGIKNIEDSWIVKPSFKTINQSYYDSIFIFKSVQTNKYGAINTSGDTLVEFYNDLIYFNLDSAVNPYGLLSLPYYFNGKVNFRSFFINRNCDCISRRYYPCPYGSRKAEGTISNALNYIELADKYLYFNNIDSAIICYKKAIQDTPNDPFVYLWPAQSLIFNKQYQNVSYTNQIIKDNKLFIDSCITKAIVLETNTHYQIRLKRIQYLYYKYLDPNTDKMKEIQKWYEDSKKKYKNDNLFHFWWKFDY
jgi:hypothetical protein